MLGDLEHYDIAVGLGLCIRFSSRVVSWRGHLSGSKRGTPAETGSVQFPCTFVTHSCISFEWIREHCWNYIFWRMNEGKSHYSLNLKPSDLCCANYQEVFTAWRSIMRIWFRKEKRTLTTLRKYPTLSKITATRRSENGTLNALRDEFSGEARLDDTALKEESSATCVVEKKTVLKESWCRSW